MPEPTQLAQPTEQQMQQLALENLVGDLPAFREGTDTGQGINVPDEGKQALEFLNNQVSQPTPQQPAPGQPVSQPSQVPPAQQAQQPPQQATPQQPSGARLYAGKYRSVEEMERGYKEAETALRTRNEENMVLKAAQLATEQITGGFRREREAPTPPPSFVPVEFQGEKPVVPIDQLRASLIEDARRAGMEAALGILNPLTQLGQANSALRDSYPEFSAQERQFGVWVSQNPRYQRLIQQDPDAGLEAAYLKYARESGTVQQAQATQSAIAAQQQVEQARQQAAPAGGASPATHRVTEQTASDQEVKRLYQVWQETGDRRPLDKYLLERKLEKGSPGLMRTLEQSQWGR